MYKTIKVLLSFFIFIFFINSSIAQQSHFIYIETQGKEVFSVLVNGKTFSSSEIGHVIISKLLDGKYELKIKFQNEKFDIQTFSCTIDKNDIGYSLKSIPSKGWVLVDMKTAKENLSNNVALGNELNDLQESSGAFGNMLSQAVNDSSLIKKKSVEDPKETIVIKEVTEDDKSLLTSIDSAVKTIDDAVQMLDDSADFAIESFNDSLNSYAPVIDTTSLNLESNTEKNKVVESLVIDSTSAEVKNDSENIVTINEIFVPSDSVKSDISNPFYQKIDEKNNNYVDNSNEYKTNQMQTNSNTIKGPPVSANEYNHACQSMVKDDDLDKIKRKMFIQNSNASMVQTALKMLGNKCLTTEQVKKLSGLFISDDGRYMLYDFMYNSVYDKFNYGVLEAQIVDPYYRKRFEAMLQQ